MKGGEERRLAPTLVTLNPAEGSKKDREWEEGARRDASKQKTSGTKRKTVVTGNEKKVKGGAIQKSGRERRIIQPDN